MTKRLVKYIYEQVPLQGINAVASNAGLDEKTIRNVYKESRREYLSHRIDPDPRHLGIVRYRHGRLSASIIIDMVERSVVDVVNGTRARDLERWILAMPQRDTIESVIVDPLRSFRSAVENALPSARLVTVPNLFDDIIADHINRNVMRKLPARRSSGIRLWFSSKGVRSTRIDRMRQAIDARNPAIGRAWRAKEMFKEIDNVTTVAEANQCLDEWFINLPDDVSRGAKTLTRDILKWRGPLTFINNPFRQVAVHLRRRLLWHIGRTGKPRTFNQIASRAMSSGYALDDRLRTCGCCLNVSRIDKGRGLPAEHIVPSRTEPGHHHKLDQRFFICAKCDSFFEERNAEMAV